MKKRFKWISLLLVWTMVITCFSSMGRVSADEYDEGSSDDEINIYVAPFDESIEWDLETFYMEDDEPNGFGIQLFSMDEMEFTGFYGDQYSDFERRVYEAMRELTPVNNTVYIEYPMNGEDPQDIFDMFRVIAPPLVHAFGYDYPDKVMWNDGSYQMGAQGSSQQLTLILSMVPSVFYTQELQTAVDTAKANILSGLQGSSRYELLKEIHDYLVNNGQYASETLPMQRGEEGFYYAHNESGILAKGRGVCESYAKAFKVLCNSLNIPCYIATSKGHAWNLVLMPNGQWYMVDCTFDDPVVTDQEGNILPDEQVIVWDYFLVSNDPEVDDEHIDDHMLTRPVTAATRYDVDREEAKIILDGCSLTLNGDISLNFYVQIPEYMKKNGFSAVIIKDGISNELLLNSSDGNTYKYSYPVCVKETGDVVTIYFYDANERCIPIVKDRVTYPDGFSYSVAQYIDTVMGSEEDDDGLKALAENMANYSAFSMDYFRYKAESTQANTGLIAGVTAENVAKYQPILSGSLNDEYYGSSLIIEDKTTIHHYFRFDDLTGMTFQVNGENVEPQSSGRYTYIEISDIAAHHMDVVYELKVYDNGSEIFCLDYSVLSYAQRVLNSPNCSVELTNLIKAMVMYYQSAEEYFAD